MAPGRNGYPDGFALGRRLVVFALVAAIIGLPINQLFGYALLVTASVFAFVGVVTPRLRRWVAACLLAVAAITGQWLLAPPRIEEGHNVFLVDGANNALVTRLPPEVFRLMAAEFKQVYPPPQWCDARTPGCWRGGSFPDRPFAFSADGVLDAPSYSRRIDAINFADPVWLRLGFINDLRYNWNSDVSDIQRLRRDGRFWMGLHRWHLKMPWFVMYRFPASYVGGNLCWTGAVIWEEENDRFTLYHHSNWACRALESDDVGRRIFGVAIRPDTLAVALDPPPLIQIRQLVATTLMLLSVAGLLGLLVRWKQHALTLPFLLIGLSLIVIAIADASFIGGVRPFDGGDDGLIYDGIARQILQNFIAGNFAEALKGGESVFYFGGPGFRYFRALEHVIFGESYLGYLSLVLLLPIAVFAAFERFVSQRWALAVVVMFVAIPLGALFGTSYFHYVKWAARGFADPAAAITAFWAVIVLVGRTRAGPDPRFAPAFGSALLFAIAVFIRPNVAPFVAVMLGGAGLAALYFRQWRRLAGLCLGFLLVAVVPLHNWYFGGVVVLSSANATHPLVFVMPPASYALAAAELFRFDFTGEYVARAVRQIAGWLSGPSEFYVMIPLHAGAIAILIYVVLGARGYDAWLRLAAGATLAQHAVSLFYIATARYHFLSWLMTFLVTIVWLKADGLASLHRYYPQVWAWAARQNTTRFLDSAIAGLERSTGLVRQSSDTIRHMVDVSRPRGTYSLSNKKRGNRGRL